MTDIVRLRDPEGRIHFAARESKTTVDGLASGTFVDIDAPDPTVAEPPRSGAGSGADVWRHYATTQGVDVTDDMNRNDLIAAVDAQREAASEATSGKPGDDLDSGTADSGPGERQRATGNTHDGAGDGPHQPVASS